MTTSKNTGTKGDQGWITPQWFFEKIEKKFGGFNFDVCADQKNSKCTQYFDEKNNGLMQSWASLRFFCNPPYSEISKWLKKGFDEVRNSPNTLGVYLLPANTDTKWFHHYASKGSIYFIKGRIQFEKADGSIPTHGNNSGSMIVVFESKKLNASNKLWAFTWDLRE